jgi:hypothetical protein
VVPPETATAALQTSTPATVLFTGTLVSAALSARSSTGGTAVIEGSGGGGEVAAPLLTTTFDLLPNEFAAGKGGLDLPADILHLDLAGPLLTGGRPQASLVPQQRNSVVPLGALLPGAPEDRAPRPGQAGTPEQDARPFLMSPFEDSLLGPSSAPMGPTPGLGKSQGFPPEAAAVADAVFLDSKAEDRTEVSGRQTSPRSVPPVRRTATYEALVLAAAVGLLTSHRARGNGLHCAQAHTARGLAAPVYLPR